MITESSIVGGYIKIQKSVFIKEMLLKESRLRALLNWRTTKDFSGEHPCVISDPDENNILTINFTYMTVDIGDSPREVLEDIKARYGDKIKGKVTCRTVYAGYGGIFTNEIDLD